MYLNRDQPEHCSFFVGKEQNLYIINETDLVYVIIILLLTD